MTTPARAPQPRQAPSGVTVHVVTAKCAVVKIGQTDEYLYRGAVLPRAVEQAELDRLTAEHLIAPVRYTTDEGDNR